MAAVDKALFEALDDLIGVIRALVESRPESDVALVAIGDQLAASLVDCVGLSSEQAGVITELFLKPARSGSVEEFWAAVAALEPFVAPGEES